jgi:hypothetical protein
MTAPRKLYVYRLKVIYPPTSHYEAEGEWDLNWEPEGWVHPNEHNWNGDPDADFSFRWPRTRRYLTREEAERRAALLTSFGAKVVVERSQPIVWESDVEAVQS